MNDGSEIERVHGEDPHLLFVNIGRQVEVIDPAWLEPERMSDAEARALDAVNEVCDMLDRAARGEDVASNLTEAIGVVEKGLDPFAPTISEAQRDRVLAAAIQVLAKAYEVLSGAISRDNLRTGMHALSAQIDMWAEPLDQRYARHGELIEDLRAHVQILRNDLENHARNEALKTEIEERAAARFQERMRRAG